MRNMTTMLLVTLLLASLLAGIPTNELDTEDTIEHTSARSGADIDILGITQPSETSCTAAGCRDELLVGESTTFEVVMKNIGTGDVEDMTYSLDIYLTDSSKTRGLLAKDSTGQDLSWTNEVAVCDDAASCDETSFAANTLYMGGAATLTQLGADITWTPDVGEYLVVVSVDSDQDTDPANDEEEIYVVVRDYTDIGVDLCWTDGAGVCVEGDRAVGTGTESRQFLLTVTADGSQEFNPREVNVSVELDGFSSASGGGFDLSVDGEDWLVVAGNPQTVEVYRNVTTDTGTDASRAVLTYQTAWTMSGQVTPDDGGYSIDARVIDYTLYGQDPSCTETWVEGGEDPETQTEFSSDNQCEFQETNDDYSRTDSDDIYGFSALFHDIRIQTLSVAQGYSADGSGEPTSVVQDGMDLDLRVGPTLLHANVGHFGSDVNKMVDWNVVFTVTDPNGVENTYNADDCPTGLAPAYTHKLLGTFGGGSGTPQDADVFGSACVMLNDEAALGVGEYTFEANLNFLGLWDNSADRLDESVTDEKASNNRKVMTLDVVNNQPSVLSMTMFNTGDLIVSQESPLEFDVLAFDVDCVAGDCLTYTWTINDEALGMCGGEGAIGAQCTFQILPEHLPSPRVAVTVTDDNGASTSDYMDLTIWNDVTAESTAADSGITIAYTVQYASTSPYTITATDSDISSHAGMDLPGYTGQYDAVAAVDFAPGALGSIDASGVLSHGMTLTVPKSLLGSANEGSMWFNQGSMYQLVDGTPADSDNDPTMSVFTWDLPATENTLTQGTFVLFGGSLEEPVAPNAGITGFSALAGEGGTLVMNWDVTDTMSLGEVFIMEICDHANDADCMNAVVKTFADSVKTYTHPGISTVHGTEYIVTVEVCSDDGLCNTQLGTGNVTADKEVDGDGAMTNLIAQASEDGTMWTMTWTTSGDTSDIDSWRICYSTNSDVASIPISGEKCTDVAAATATTVDVMQPTFTGTETYYFVGVAVDDLGNDRRASDAATEVFYKRDADFTNNDDGNGTVGEDVSGESELPGWTLPAIGGVVVAAIVVGAIIVTRGGGGGGDKDWDY